LKTQTIHTFLITKCFSVAVITKTFILRLALCILQRHCKCYTFCFICRK